MRYKDKSTLDRIEQYLKDHMQTQVENSQLYNEIERHQKSDSISSNIGFWEYKSIHSVNELLSQDKQLKGSCLLSIKKRISKLLPQCTMTSQSWPSTES